jgi:phage protein D
MSGYPELRVVVDGRGSSYRCATWVEAQQLHSLNPGSSITQKDDALSPVFVVKGPNDKGEVKLF